MQDKTAIMEGSDDPPLLVHTREQNKPRLSKRIFRLLVHGDVAGRYGGDPMRMAMAIIAEAARVGMDVGQIIHLMMRDDHAGGEWVRNLSVSHRFRTVERLYQTSFNSYVEPFENAVDARLYLAECMDAVRSAALPHAKESTRRVLYAHLQVAMGVGCTRYAASIRRLAVDAGVGVETARAATAWAVQQGLMQHEKPSRGAQAATYRISRQFAAKVVSIVPTVKGGCIGTKSCTRADVIHVAFSYGTGLSYAVWSHLDTDAGVTIDYLVETTGRAKRTVKNNLRRFEEHGLAEELDDGSWRSRATGEDLDRVAEKLGVTEFISAREQRIRTEQQQMHEWSMKWKSSLTSSNTLDQRKGVS